MDIPPIFQKIAHFSPKLMTWLEKQLMKTSKVQLEVDKEMEKVLPELDQMVNAYKQNFNTHHSLPEEGISRDKVLEEIRKISMGEQKRWKEGYVSGAVYHGEDDHVNFLNEVYAIQSQSNPLHSDLFPSASKFESEIISMTASMLGGGGTDDDICGAVTSGGTESILLAMKSYRDFYRTEKGIKHPNIIVPVTAHAAFDKAGEYFGIMVIKIPIDDNFLVDVSKLEKAVNHNTICIVGSAPNFPHGLIDPITDLSKIAKRNNIGLHVDACLGGFVLPFACTAGFPVPPFDFKVEGVTSISADTHKFGYAAKGTSVILYGNTKLRSYQYYTIADWPGGLYFSPTFAGSRPGALSAVCWAAMLAMGEKGYLEAVTKIIHTAGKFKSGIAAIPELELIGDPLWVIAFKSDSLDVYRIMDKMTEKGWNLNGLHKPSCIHICITLRQTQKGVSERFQTDLRDAVEFVKANPAHSTGMAPVYGMAASLPFRGVIKDILKKYMDLYYKA